jgi:signal transduction histidine kinase
MGSLKLRLWIAGGYLIVITLAIAGLGIVLLFEWQLERQVVDDLEVHVNQIVAGLENDEAGQLKLQSPPTDARFLQPYTGLYWQIADADDNVILKSRSLWTDTIKLPESTGGGLVVHRELAEGPRNNALLVLEGLIDLPAGFQPPAVRVAIGFDRTWIDARLNIFVSEVLKYLGILALVLIVGGYLQVAFGLKPVMRVRDELASIRSGKRQRLGDTYPEELQPLADELNDLLDAQDRNLDRARARAGDLAHGFKTQLAVLGSEIRQLRDAGDSEAAERIESVADTMQRQVEREVTRARANALALSRNLRTNIKPIIEKLSKTLSRTPRGECIPMTIDAPEMLNVAMDQQDLLEVLGNILENAIKWAETSVNITARRDGSEIVLDISDDGPGIPEEKREQVLQRGVRLDMRKPGSGLGLDIVSELVSAYSGRVRLDVSRSGGLAVQLTLPAA